MDSPSGYDAEPDACKVAERLVAGLATHDGVLGVIRTGTRTPNARDRHSDHDFLVVCTLAGPAAKAVRTTAESVGLGRDDAASRHFPLDEDGYLTGDDECIEIPVLELGEVERQIHALYSGEALDEGLIHLLLAGSILFDRFGIIASLRDRIRARGYPEAALGKLLETKPHTALKLLRTSVNRGDLPQIAYWLARLFEDSMRVIFAHNGMFYPGPKRAFQRLQELRWVPDGFQCSYGQLFADGAESELLLKRAVSITESVAAGPSAN